MVKVPAMLSFGLWFMVSGSAGYERYMLQGDMAGATFDACLQIAGLALFYAGAVKVWAAINARGL